MYTPPMFKPDRAASLAFAEARIRYGLRMGRHQARRILAARFTAPTTIFNGGGDNLTS